MSDILKQLWETGTLSRGIWETVYMTFLSTLIAYIVGLPLGVVLAVTGEGGIRPMRWLNRALGIIVNVFRSIPFIVLMVAMLPVAKAVVGTALGNQYPLVAMAKKELFQIKLLGPLISALGAFPVDRGTADIGAIKTSLKAVKEGKKLLIFPEGGTKHKAGDEAKVGAAMIAARTGAPIVPIYISENKKFRSRVYVVFGDAYIPEKTKSKDGYRAIADDMMRRIYALKEKI